MTYFKLNNNDYSMYVNKLEVGYKHKYTSRENAAGNLMVKHITKKRIIQVGIIPLEADALKQLLADLNAFEVTVECIDPETDTLENMSCIIPTSSIEYHTIRADKVLTKAFTFSCEEK